MERKGTSKKSCGPGFAGRCFRPKPAGVLRECHFDVRADQRFLLDYVALRALGAHSRELLDEVPPGCTASVMADRWLHGESAVGVQRCAVRRGFVPGYDVIYDDGDTEKRVPLMMVADKMPDKKIPKGNLKQRAEQFYESVCAMNGVCTKEDTKPIYGKVGTKPLG